MFDKRLMAMCPESKKYIVGNIFCQWIELMMNALMIYIITGAVGKLYRGEMTAKSMLLSLGILACVLIVRFFSFYGHLREFFYRNRGRKRKRQIHGCFFNHGAKHDKEGNHYDCGTKCG